VSSASAVQEYFSGYEAYKSIKILEKDFDTLFSALSQNIVALSKKIFTKNRLLISHTGTPDPALISQIISIVPAGEEYESSAKIEPLGIRREGIAVPAQASFAELAGNVYLVGEELSGSFNVARSLISYGYLWGAVRVQGGAYGVGLIVRNSGNVGFYSYRDPSPERSIECYRGAAEFLRGFAESGEDITKFIIGAVGDVSPLATSKLKGVISTTRYLRGKTYEDECRARRELLETDKRELLRIADILDKICDNAPICIVAGKDKLNGCKEIDTILEI
jgi:Zn-dependent M16 (insulinase) family peptidase